MLKTALQSLCDQSTDASHYEIIIVDNASTDQTPVAVQEFQSQYTGHTIRYVRETKQGLSHARNRGWMEAQSPYVAYFDDDCKAPENWMDVARQIIETIKPDVFGGPYRAFYNAPKPDWYKDSYGSWSIGEHSHFLEPERWEFLCGTNMVYRCDLMQKIGGFDVNLGMSGSKIGYGEETALQRHLKQVYPETRIYYDPALYVYHLVRPEVTKLHRIARQRFAGGRTLQQMSPIQGTSRSSRYRHQAVLLWQMSRIVGQIMIDLSWKTLRRNKIEYPALQNYWCEHSFPYLEKLGKKYQTLKSLMSQ